VRSLFQKAVDFVLLPVLSICCITVTVLAVKHQFFRPEAPLPSRPTDAAKGRVRPDSLPREVAGLSVGPDGAPLRIVEFADFQCPFCSVASTELRELRAKHPGAFTVVFKHSLIPGHVYARGAALAAECAAEQGRFSEYYDLLFEQRAKLAKRAWSDFAKDAGV
jgi:protein-disulfide isomerase